VVTAITIIAIAGIFAFFGYRLALFLNHSAGQGDQGAQIILSTSTRPYDRNAHRFDGLAFPQYKITYVDEDGVVTEREIYVDTWRERGSITYYTCWCFLRDERRTFRSDRILKTINVQTGRQIKDIASYLLRG